ncbi:hypothetical protein AXG93_399s1050 [Marchantia polymorpha subsp. ruderalis]|uniref:Uncharacterized protein n=1 Tax=Marchantia polymorpha subsp. ruderalis TaxID=1480154 RepID=A0A176WIE2_MARPO|nr:hypothetical protein AXG93_399s1050 [Marchantia polymorpha subsp. ruderalis]
MVQEWDNDGAPKPPSYLENPKTWQIWNETKVLESCAGDDDDLTFDSESIKVTRAKEKSNAALFKKPRTGKNGYRSIGYHNRFRKNVAMAFMQILRPSRTTYMMTWQVGTKMKARQLILEADSSTKSRAAALQGRPNPEVGAKLNVETVVKEKEVLVKKDLRTSMVLAVSSDTEADPVATEKIAERVVEDLVGETVASQQVIPLLYYLDSKRGKYAVDLRNRLEASRVAFNVESRRVDELIADSARREQGHVAELAAKKMKALAECEVATILDQELIEKLEAKCNELSSERSQTEEQLYEMEAKLSEAEEKN